MKILQNIVKDDFRQAISALVTVYPFDDKPAMLMCSNLGVDILPRYGDDLPVIVHDGVRIATDIFGMPITYIEYIDNDVIGIAPRKLIYHGEVHRNLISSQFDWLEWRDNLRKAMPANGLFSFEGINYYRF